MDGIWAVYANRSVRHNEGNIDAATFVWALSLRAPTVPTCPTTCRTPLDARIYSRNFAREVMRAGRNVQRRDVVEIKIDGSGLHDCPAFFCAPQLLVPFSL